MTRAMEVVERLGGDWWGTHGLVPGPGHSKQDRSVSVRDTPNGIRIHSFAGEDWKHIKDAWRREGVLMDDQQNLDPDPIAVQRRRQESDARKAHLEKLARKIWRSADVAKGTIVETYLKSRGLSLKVPGTIRFAPRAVCTEIKGVAPAMITAIVDRNGYITGVHRTFLASNGEGKANLKRAKLTLGRCRGSAARLAKPQAGKPLILAEGIETALAIQEAKVWPVWAGLSAATLENVTLPSSLPTKNIIIAADGDDPGRRAASRLRTRLECDGLNVRVVEPTAEGQDFLDELNHGRMRRRT